ncbi:MAG: histidine kinase, partial [Methanomicrobiales archaeon]|nr:histidine kinase [Methanomicrobiales archaeon]
MENLLSKSPKKETVSAIEIMRAQEVVRKDNARLLHDTTAQDLTNLVLCVEIAIRLFDVDPARAKDALH